MSKADVLRIPTSSAKSSNLSNHVGCNKRSALHRSIPYGAMPVGYCTLRELRNEYWKDFKPKTYKNSIVFFDPDNGFETKTQNGTKWIRHDELKMHLSDLPDDSAIMVYQHRPRRTWGDVFAELKDKLDYADTVIAAYESDIAFVAITKNKKTGDRISKLINAYANDHLDVCFKKIK